MTQREATSGAQPKRPRGRPKGSSGRSQRITPEQSELRSQIKEQKQNFVMEKILSAAAELIAARGFRAVTIDDISASLGFTKSVIYYYLKSKNDILWRIFGRILDAYFQSLEKIASAQATPDAKLTAIIKQHALSVMTHRDWTVIFHRDEPELEEAQRKLIARKKRQYDAVVEDIYREGVSRGLFVDVPAHIAVASLLGSCNWINTWYDPDGPLSAETIADHYASLLANGFMAKRTGESSSR